jgi:hypothetical protein
MSAVLDRIIEEVRALPPDELRLLREELDRMQAESHAAFVREVKGKYAHVPTSSEAFAARKAEEIALEDRRSRT